MINVEAVAALDPDLIVAEWWPVEEAYSGLEEGANTSADVMHDIAPVVGPAQGPSIVEMIEDYAELAESLGAGLDDPAISEGATGSTPRWPPSRTPWPCGRPTGCAPTTTRERSSSSPRA